MKCVWFCAALLLTSCGASDASSEFTFIEMKGLNNWAMVVPPSSKPEAVEAAAKAKCAGQTQCSVYGWPDRANVATAFPMLDREAEAENFAYSLNRDSNFERSLFDCSQFKVSKDRCLAPYEKDKA